MKRKHTLLFTLLAFASISQIHAMEHDEKDQPSKKQKTTESAEQQAEIQEELFSAAMNGKAEDIEDLINQGADVNALDQDNVTTLHWAVSGSKDLPTIHELIKHGAIMLQNNNGNTPLHYAADENLTEIVKTLLFADSGKTIKQFDNYEAIATFLLSLKEKNYPLISDLIPKVLLPLTSWPEMLMYVLPHADNEQISYLVKYCPHAWFVEAFQNMDIQENKKQLIIAEIVKQKTEEADEFCKVKNKTTNETAYDFTRDSELKNLLDPDNSIAREAFIREKTTEEFQQ